MKDMCVKFHLSDSAYITALRLVAGAVCSAYDMDVDVSEDFKVCVTESCIILKNCGFESATVTFVGGDDVRCIVEGEGGIPKVSENEFSLALISALVGECEIERAGEIIKRVSLKI